MKHVKLPTLKLPFLALLFSSSPIMALPDNTPALGADQFFTTFFDKVSSGITKTTTPTHSNTLKVPNDGQKIDNTEFLVYDNDSNLEFSVSLNANSQYHGKWTKYRPDGTIIYKTNYINGVQDGTRMDFDIDGQLISTVSYDDGSIISSNSLRVIKEIEIPSKSLPDAQTTMHKFYDDNNILEFEVSVNPAGKFHGEFIKYLVDGTINYRHTYMNGSRIDS
jgi:antitoxin component YwqK of YwqJK toxin-antitoxin module